nr:hypothetical protein [uncultured Prevotella sp.]
MKNLYIKPVTHVVALTYDVVLLGQSTEGCETSDFGAKKHEFADDSFDNTAWPKDKSPWED